MIRPDARHPPAAGILVADLLKSRRQLQVENLFLRHQLNVAFAVRTQAPTATSL